MAITWLLHRVTDPNDNFIQYDYEDDTVNGVYRPTTIQYTGHGASFGRQKIIFEYDDLPAAEQITRFRFGAASTPQKRLAAIHTESDAQTVRTYEL